MNIDPQTLYWITRLDHISNMMLFFIIISIFSSIIIFLYDLNLEEDKRTSKVWKTTIFTTIIALVLIVGRTFIPSTKEMCAIQVIPMIANNDNIKQIGNGITDLAKEWLVELKPKTEENK